MEPGGAEMEPGRAQIEPSGAQIVLATEVILLMFSFVFAHAEVFQPLFSIDLAVELVLLTPHAGDIVRPACEKRRWQALHGRNDTKKRYTMRQAPSLPRAGPRWWGVRQRGSIRTPGG